MIRQVDEMQSSLGVKSQSSLKFIIERKQKTKSLSEFEQALIVARNKVKETTDKVDERQNKICIFGPKNKVIIRKIMFQFRNRYSSKRLNSRDRTSDK